MCEERQLQYIKITYNKKIHLNNPKRNEQEKNRQGTLIDQSKIGL